MLSPQGYMLLRDIIARMRHDGCKPGRSRGMWLQ